MADQPHCQAPCISCALPVSVPGSRCAACVMAGKYPPAWWEAWQRALKIQGRLQED
jgi:hypothetical protein